MLLVEPLDHHDGQFWTVAKGEPNAGEAQEVAALSLVLEESGVEAKILAPVPAEFLGGRSGNRYWVMAVVRDTGKFGWETQSVRWADVEEAKQLIGLTANKTGRARDLAVLEGAVAVWRELAG